MAFLGFIIGIFIAVALMPFLGFWIGFLIALLCLAIYLASGMSVLRSIQSEPNVPQAVPSLRLAFKVGMDESIRIIGLLFFFSDQDHNLPETSAELTQLLKLIDTESWDENPKAFFEIPHPLKSPNIKQVKLLGSTYEHLTFESGYNPHDGMPGRERWLSRQANQVAHAYVLRHPGPPRPWLICIPGMGGGFALTDFGSFNPREYSERLGLNMLIPVLPLHGPRRIKHISGQGLSNPVDIVHESAQAIWDIRRLISWIRAEGGTKIAVSGMSLGSYTAALLSNIEPNLECIIARVPQTDWMNVLYGNMDDTTYSTFQAAGLDKERVSKALSLVSPLSLPSLLPKDRLAINAGVADRIIFQSQVQALETHWGHPRCLWFQGTHLVGASDPAVLEFVESTLAMAGMLEDR